MRFGPTLVFMSMLECDFVSFFAGLVPVYRLIGSREGFGPSHVMFGPKGDTLGQLNM